MQAAATSNPVPVLAVVVKNNVSAVIVRKVFAWFLSYVRDSADLLRYLRWVRASRQCSLSFAQVPYLVTCETKCCFLRKERSNRNSGNWLCG